jgi:hypothetical protein
MKVTLQMQLALATGPAQICPLKGKVERSNVDHAPFLLLSPSKIVLIFSLLQKV